MCKKELKKTSFYKLDQWSSWCAPVYNSVHRNIFTVHRNFSEVK